MLFRSPQVLAILALASSSCAVAAATTQPRVDRRGHSTAGLFWTKPSELAGVASSDGAAAETPELDMDETGAIYQIDPEITGGDAVTLEGRSKEGPMTAFLAADRATLEALLGDRRRLRELVQSARLRALAEDHDNRKTVEKSLSKPHLVEPVDGVVAMAAMWATRNNPVNMLAHYSVSQRIVSDRPMRWAFAVENHLVLWADPGVDSD